VNLVYTPGHTPGHLSVLVQLQSGPALLIGDAVFTVENLRRGVLPYWTSDDQDYRSSMEQIRAYAASEPEALLIPTHDEQAWLSLP
jgi:glyoxylase-like metal-dependent hydrolase (beta-lactamase superfamily II)